VSTGPAAPAKHAELSALATELRPELHRYSARPHGSVIEGEDVVQDTFARAFAALDELKKAPPLRPWLFRIATTARWICCAAARSVRPSPLMKSRDRRSEARILRSC